MSMPRAIPLSGLFLSKIQEVVNIHGPLGGDRGGWVWPSWCIVYPLCTILVRRNVAGPVQGSPKSLSKKKLKYRPFVKLRVKIQLTHELTEQSLSLTGQ
jgi:hypothetical protein